MKTYIKFSDLPYYEQLDLFTYIKGPYSFMTLEDFNENMNSVYNDSLAEIICENGSSEDIDSFDNSFTRFTIIGNDYVFYYDDDDPDNKVKVITREEFDSSCMVTIPKLEYDRLLQIEKFYNAINNDN